MTRLPETFLAEPLTEFTATVEVDILWTVIAPGITATSNVIALVSGVLKDLGRLPIDRDWPPTMGIDGFDD
jgi:hypothetical protein